MAEEEGRAADEDHAHERGQREEVVVPAPLLAEEQPGEQAGEERVREHQDVGIRHVQVPQRDPGRGVLHRAEYAAHEQPATELAAAEQRLVGVQAAAGVRHGPPERAAEPAHQARPTSSG